MIFIGLIAFDRTKVLGRGDNFVYEGTLDGRICAVKRVLKPSGPSSKEDIEKVEREMKNWFLLCGKISDESLPIFRWFDCDATNHDFWLVI